MRLLAVLLPLILRIANAVDVAFPTNIEIDVIFPRNDTYGPADVFPVVFALQGATAAWNFGFQFEWQINYADSYTDHGILATGSLWVSSLLERDLPPQDPFILANRTLVLTQSSGDHQYVLSWEFGFFANCSIDGSTFTTEGVPSNTNGSLLFTMQNDAKPPVITEPGACPAFGSAVGIQANITGCPHVGDSGKDPNPCAVQIDSIMASSVSAAISTGLATAASTTSSAPTASPTSSGSPSTSSQTGNLAPRLRANVVGAVGLAALLV